MGFDLAFGSLFIKTWQIRTNICFVCSVLDISNDTDFIFNTQQLHIRKVSRGILLSVVGALLIVEACVTAAWVLTDGPRAVLVVRLCGDVQIFARQNLPPKSLTPVFRANFAAVPAGAVHGLLVVPVEQGDGVVGALRGPEGGHAAARYRPCSVLRVPRNFWELLECSSLSSLCS